MRTFVLSLSLIVLFACGGQKSEESEQSAEKSKLKLGLVFDIGGLGDKSFNDASYKGLKKASDELDAELIYLEPTDGSERETAMRQLIAQGCKLIYGIGFIFTDDITRLAEEFPKVHFACVDYSVTEGKTIPPNLAAIKFREEEGSYLAGAVAALVSKTKVIGFVGGMESPLIRKFENGYREGALKVESNIEVLTAYAGVTGEAFKNPTRGKEIALAQISRGADVIFHASGSTGLGVFEAVRENNKLAIGVDVDQWDEAPGFILTSMTKVVNQSVYDVAMAEAEGAFPGGEIDYFGLSNNGVDYVYNDKNKQWITDEIRAKVEALRQKIIDGEITVSVE